MMQVRILQILLFVSIVGFVKPIQAQCPTSDQYFTTQEEVDGFKVRYPDCTELEVDLIIDWSEEPYDGYMTITSLTGLSNLKSIDGLLSLQGEFQIDGPQTLEGLESLEYVKHLSIKKAYDLETIDALGALKEVDVFELQAVSILSYIPYWVDFVINDALRVKQAAGLASFGGLRCGVNMETVELSGLSIMASYSPLLSLKKVNELRLNMFGDFVGFGEDFNVTVRDRMVLGASPYSEFKEIKGIHLSDTMNTVLLINLKEEIDLSSWDNLRYITDSMYIDRVENVSILENVNHIAHLQLYDLVEPISVNENLEVSDEIILNKFEEIDELNLLSDLNFTGNKISVLNSSFRNINGLQLDPSRDDYSLFLDFLPEFNDISFISGISKMENVFLRRLDALSDFHPFSALTESSNDFTLRDLPLLTDLMGFQNLSTVGSLWLSSLPIEDLTGLSSLQSVSGGTPDSVDHFFIDQNPLLKSLDGLDAIESIGLKRANSMRFYINRNEVFKSLDALDGAEADLAYLGITSNINFRHCDSEFICRYLETSIAAIHGNGMGCDSVEEVLVACTTGVEETTYNENSDLLLYPNPGNSIINVSLWSNDLVLQWKLIDANGIVVKSGQGHQIPVDNVETGVYVVKVGQYCEKVVVHY